MDVYAIGGCKQEEITEAQKTLGVLFAADYVEYLLAYGAALFEGHELTGICKSKRLNVVDVTLAHRKEGIPGDWYVVEEANMDDVVYWQDKEGRVYESVPGSQAVKCASGLYEYCFE